MFEKSLYDLIRGLRNHKGNEREYIQHSLRECRAEIRGSDMDLKATALLKLIYLEMFGHDMSWASFNVLEVMSSAKYLQKRVGYLGAVQSFRADTEVLMLATNLLKKDISSPLIPTMSLPIVTLPHIITPSLAFSLLNDLTPRLSHSNPSIRKKTIAALYRLALVYPETLRPAWPKIKDMLTNEEEDPSVTAAIVNVVCELGWRRPRDFLPLAPRLFDLLVEGGNNWMAIKIIKLFATLTPLEPRLVKKLLPPLITLIRTTPAMSLLYECINGIIQGGILEGTDGAREGDEVAALCVAKLRGMIIVEGDPNLKYVALLAFNKIVVSHPGLVSMHQDVIMSCIDDPDISIRQQALELGSGMISSENLMSVVDRLMRQLRDATSQISQEFPVHEVGVDNRVEPAADSDGEDPEMTLRASEKKLGSIALMPDEYKMTVIRQILAMCSRDTYANITDFEWYIETLVELVRLVPSSNTSCSIDSKITDISLPTVDTDYEVSCEIGRELRNIAVRVGTVRVETVRAVNLLVASVEGQKPGSHTKTDNQGILRHAAWIVGEFADKLSNPHHTLCSLLLPSNQSLSSIVLSAYLQAIPKLLVSVITQDDTEWCLQRRTMVALLLARIIHFLEPLTMHPNLEVQERSVEFLELMRVAAEAVAGHELDHSAGPLLLTQAIPSLFLGLELNPVAATAQQKVPPPDCLDLDVPLNSKLSHLLQFVDQAIFTDVDSVNTEQFYYQRPVQRTKLDAAADTAPIFRQEVASYQQDAETATDPEILARKRAERRERNKDDPFYIHSSDGLSPGITTDFHEILRRSNGEDVDIDSIPIMDLDVGDKSPNTDASDIEHGKPKPKHHRKVHVAPEETINLDDAVAVQNVPISSKTVETALVSRRDKAKKSLLEVDSSGIGSFSLKANDIALPSGQLEVERREVEEAEMAKALAEVERLRLEMQRASERIQVADGIPIEGTLVKKKKKKKISKATETRDDASVEDSNNHADVPSNPKTKKKRKTLKKDSNLETQAIEP